MRKCYNRAEINAAAKAFEACQCEACVGAGPRGTLQCEREQAFLRALDRGDDMYLASLGFSDAEIVASRGKEHRS